MDEKQLIQYIGHMRTHKRDIKLRHNKKVNEQ